jgi:tetratricopeptide (TPR) repeat protein
MYGRASEVVDAAYPHDHARRGMLENNIGVLYRDLGQDDVARAHFERSRTLLQRHGSDHVDVAAPLSNLASIALDEERYDDAFALVTRAIEVREAELGSMHVQLATPLVVLGRVQDARGETEAARAAFERAIAVAEAIGGPDHPQAASAAEHLAGLLLAQGDVEEARAAATRSLATRERIAEMPTALASAQFTLAQVLARSEPARARELAALSLSTYVDAGRPYEARVEQIRTWQRQHGR